MFQRAELPVKLAGVEASRAFFAPCLDASGGSTLLVAHLDDQARCLQLSSYPRRDDQPELPVRQIVADAVRYSSAGVMLAESKGSLPGQIDQASTRRLAAAAEAIDLTVLDHLIFMEGRCTSLRRKGLL